MSNEVDVEVIEIASRLNQKHGPALSRAACLVTLTEALFAGSGLADASQGTALLALQRECVSAWLQQQGLDADSLDGAVTGLLQGAESARYLEALPA